MDLETFTQIIKMFICWEFIPNAGAATEKACLSRPSLVLGTESFCEVDDLSCIGLFDRCMTRAPNV